MKGRSVRLFLVDGTPTGLITAEVMNWVGHVLMTPRSRLVDALAREEASRTGVYILLGEDPENPTRTKAYIGEGDNIANRIKAHAKDETKDFWTRACLISSKDKNLTKAHIRYLEGRLIDKAIQAGRADLANGTSPDIVNFLPESDESDMEFFLSQIEVVLPVLGVDILRERPKVSLSTDTTTSLQKDVQSPHILALYLESKKHGYRAQAIEQDGEFVVLKGSTALADPPHTSDGYAKLRISLIENNTLASSEPDNGLLVFLQDVSFNSPSAAASVISGRNSNGRWEWRLMDTNQTLKDWQIQQLESKLTD
ncbi:GIY-YIG nuclease family protein [Hirschia baltica]|uniref:GIY-YIG domain-containing protein n=1 Tax=Hirschia baltica (strain ATCC 49814 / DSM 5838 / IFAM 1418) TaxID=582402 RepID=C6XJM9_HIRBI|nr:GIY-YIG nuclease family protein [Hirschia baltica]ACT59324.1 conserved hypothetical protein [Hirschia baltica ATCC 49814]